MNLATYFKEKDIPYRTFEIEKDGITHIIDNETIIDIILNKTPIHEQEEIWGVISQIDFRNGDINHILNHLAKGYVETNF